MAESEKNKKEEKEVKDSPVAVAKESAAAQKEEKESKPSQEQAIEATAAEEKKRFLSLRLKIILGFTVLFAVIFAAAFYWFYTFTTQQAMNLIQEDLEKTIIGAAEYIDGDQMIELFEAGEDIKNEDGFSDDPRYDEQLAYLSSIHDIEPRAYAYNYVKAPEDDMVNVLYYIADAWNYDGPSLDAQLYNPDNSVSFLKAKTSSRFSVAGFSGLTLNIGYPAIASFENWCYNRSIALNDEDYKNATIANWCDDPEENLPKWYLNLITTFQEEKFVTYVDEWGRWVSAYHPVTDSSGEVIGAIGIDFKADYVDQVREAIRQTIFIAFAITYSIIFVVVFLFSRALTQPILSLTEIAKQIGEGDYGVDFTELTQDRFPDEIDTLASVFDIMVGKVRVREERLKQRVQELQIMIDSTKRDEQVSEIVDSDFFQELRDKAKEMRSRKGSKETD